ncbi:protein transport protein Sec24C-like isoform X2 [Actinia tenebrosa]|uniref:Protein transport protein Sec24C-like isoform X2 n=1 Tax=Actinia tenebrosa TaxID=6105 RepID=A0A6P8I2F0_ACTTE|nr:protein transport protein Sec24C-like isoform X2 [Actinia tenebrosa]
MMSQGPPPPGAGYRNQPFDGNLKGGQQNGPQAPFPPQQFTSNMSNGQMNGVFDNRQPQFPQQMPQKGGLPYQTQQMPPPGGQQPPRSQPQQLPPTSQYQQQRPQQHPSHQQQRPGMPPQQPPTSQQQRPGMPPQQNPSQQQQRPGMPPQHPTTSQQQRPGMPPQQHPQQQQRPGMPPQQPPTSQQQRPGMQPQQNPSQQQQRPGMPPQHPTTSQQQRPGMPPQPPTSQQQQQQPGMPPHPSHQQQRPGMPPQPPTSQRQPGMPPHSRPPIMSSQINQQMQNLDINASQSSSMSMGWSQQQPARPPMPSYPPMPTGGPGQPGPPQSGLTMNPPSSMAGPPMMPGMGGQPGMPPTSYPVSQSGHHGYPSSGPSHPGQRPHMAGPGMSGPMGQPMQQQKRIDPDQMPSPIQVMKDDQETHKDGPFLTNTRGRIPPLVSSKFVVKDDGNCSPRFMRSTMYNVPCNKDLLQASDIPFAVVITPFAEIPINEGYLPVINHGVNGPVRCNRCKAYINPFVQFIDGGRRFVCNICSYSTEVPSEYFCHLDHQGLRVDLYERPELHLGSYEFVATTDYCKDQKYPDPPAYIFMIDVSYQSIQCGMVRLLMKEIGELLDHLPKEYNDEQSRIKVGFVTYSNHLHFYNIKENLAQPQMMVVSDVEDVFVPLLDGFLVNVEEARSVIDSLLEQITTMFADSRDTETVLGPVIQAGVEALKSAGIAGKLFVFHSSLPIAEAPGKLKNREDRKLLATDKEKTILAPQTNFYETLAKSCVENGVTVDLFVFPNAYIDLATIGCVASLTGGQIFRYSYFKEASHGQQFREDLKKTIECKMGFDTVMRLRCSSGLRPVDFHGNFYMSNTTDVELAGINPQQAIAIEIKHDDKLQEDSTAYLQCALLYTSVSGQRRLRIHNLACNTCTQLSELFRCCEMDTFVNFVSKQAVKQVLTTVPKDIRERLINQCAQILACYRRNCASPSSAGQLILPECMKLLPLYVNCIIKNDALSGGSEMSSDDRNWLMRKVLSMDQSLSVPFFYPRLFPVHDVDVESTGLPEQIRSSMERMSDNGMYILDNGIALFLWVGLQVDPNLLQQVFGVPTIGQVDIEMTSLPTLENPLSSRLRGIIEEILQERQQYLKLTVVRQRDKLEPWFKHFLVEDKGLSATQQSYVDFLCLMHKEIRSLLN